MRPTWTGPSRRQIQRTAAESLKRVTLELGGKGPGIALPDAPIELTARGATLAFLLGSGQICISGTRLFLHDSIHDQVVARMVALAWALKDGSPFDPETTLGPMAFKAHYERVLNYIHLGREEGATLACGGEPMHVPGFENGLSAGIWTGDPIAAQTLAHRLEAGTVWINDWHAITGDMSFGGTKQSGYGREINIASMEAYLETKNYMTSFETDPGAKAIFGLVHRNV